MENNNMIIAVSEHNSINKYIPKGEYSDEIISTFVQKLECLLSYLSKFENCPKQGTDEWKLIKQNYIGGSELSTLNGNSPFNSIDSLIAKKAGNVGFGGSIKTRWGNIFEPITTRYVEIDKNTKVFGDDIFIIGDIEGQAYSPDGLCVIINTEYEEQAYDDIETYIAKHVPRIILCEFKAPFNRIPTGKIPPYYISQPKSGLDTIEITEEGLFVECVFRRCMWHDLGNNRKFLTNMGQKDCGIRSYPLAYGFMVFYLDTNDITEFNVNLLLEFEEKLKNELSNDDFYDFAEASESLLDSLFTLVVDKKMICINYSDVYIGENDGTEKEMEYIQKMYSNNANIKLYGVLSWKLIDVFYNSVKKEVGYLNNYAEIIKDVLTKVNYYRKNPDKINELNTSPNKKRFYPPKAPTFASFSDDF